MRLSSTLATSKLFLLGVLLLGLTTLATGQTVCPINCSKCSSSTVCTTCDTGYYVDFSKKCSRCLSSCATCNSGTSCTKCKSGSYLTFSSSCSACSLGCATCTSGLGSDCTECQTGYYKASYGCDYCPYRCTACTGYDTGKCTACDSDYELVNGICETRTAQNVSLGGGAVTGITIGAFACCAMIIVIIICACRKKQMVQQKAMASPSNLSANTAGNLQMGANHNPNNWNNPSSAPFMAQTAPNQMAAGPSYNPYSGVAPQYPNQGFSYPSYQAPQQHQIYQPAPPQPFPAPYSLPPSFAASNGPPPMMTITANQQQQSAGAGPLLPPGFTSM